MLPKHGALDICEVGLLLDQIDQKLQEYDSALAEEPRTVDRARAGYLEMLARYAHQLAARVLEVVRGDQAVDTRQAEAMRTLHSLATTLATKAEERSRQTWDQHFAWAAATGRHLRDHHLVGLRRWLLSARQPAAAAVGRPRLSWLCGGFCSVREVDSGLHARRGFSAQAWRELEQGRL